MPADLEKARELFLHAVGNLPPEQWDGYLVEACGGDAELEQQVRRFLQVHRDAGSFLEHPAAAVGATGAFTPAPAELLRTLAGSPGTRVGPYQLLESLGEGGMGTVWLAEQTAPVKRHVALKVIKPGMDSRQVVARFEAERQALALMDHPNIARVFDGGATASGRPYFVMELVQGVPITRYCDEQRLTPRQRLELFVPVCQAVQHAHQKGIIHRDLKPSNVLIALYDGKPVPKVIDFGIAKATGSQLTPATLVTGLGVIVGTLEYMSPEQAEPNNPDIDTRSDVYSLGVVLYELLTGTTPLERRRLKGAGLLEALRIIREEETPRPSTRLSTVAELPSIAACRSVEPAKLSRLFRGELDWIVMKALEKDRTRRYETANGLAQDVQRYLADEPVQACPPSKWYRFRKFVRRNKRILATAAVVTALLLATVVVQALNNQWLRQEQANTLAALNDVKARTKRTRAALDKMSSAIIDDWLGRQPKLTAEQKQFLEFALGQYEEFTREAGDTAEQRFGLALAHARVGGIRHNLGLWAEAGTALARARELLARLTQEHPEVPDYAARLAATDGGLAQVQMHLGQREKALTSYQSAQALLEDLVRDHPRLPTYGAVLAATHVGLAALQEELGRPEKARADYEAARTRLEPLVKDHPREPKYAAVLVTTLTNLAALLQTKLRQPQEALEAYEAARVLGEWLVKDHPGVLEYEEPLARTYNHLGNLQLDFRQWKEALGSFEAACSRREKLLRDHPGRLRFAADLGATYANLALLEKEKGNLGAALGWLDKAIATLEPAANREPRLGEAGLFLINAYHGRIDLFRKLGRRKEMLTCYEAIRALRERLVQENPRDLQHAVDLARTHNNLGNLYGDFGLREQSVKSYEAARVLREKLVKDQPGAAQHAVDLGGTYCNLGHQCAGDAALAWYDKAIATLEPVARREESLAEARLSLKLTYEGKAEALRKLGRRQDALKSYETLVAFCRRQYQEHRTDPGLAADLARTHGRLGDFQMQLRLREESLKSYEAVRVLREQLVKDYPDAPEYAVDLGGTYCNLGHLFMGDDALAWYDKAIATLKPLYQQEPRPVKVLEFLINSYASRAATLGKLGRPDEEVQCREALRSLREQRVRENRDNPRHAADLARTHAKLGDLQVQLGQEAAAFKSYDAARVLREQLVHDHPTVRPYAVDLGGTYCNLGNRLKGEAALPWYDKAIAVLGPISKEPMQPRARLFLRNSHLARAWVHVLGGRFRPAVADLDRAIELDEGPARADFRMRRAWCLAHVEPSEAVAAADQLIQGDRPSGFQLYGAARVWGVAGAQVKDADDREKHGSRAVALLRQARARGYNLRLDVMKQDPAFNPLRQRADFNELLGELKKTMK